MQAGFPKLPESIQSTHTFDPFHCSAGEAPGNHSAIGGLKVVTANGWFAARPSGTEEVYKLYAESFRDDEHLNTLVTEARALVTRALTSN